MTLLELALEARNGRAMQMILNKGANADQKLKNQHNLVFCACAQGYQEGVILLVSHGADITVRSSRGLTCLLVATKKRHFGVAAYLLQVTDCGVNSVDKKGYSALHYASVNNHAPTISKLIQYGASIEARNAVGLV